MLPADASLIERSKPRGIKPALHHRRLLSLRVAVGRNIATEEDRERTRTVPIRKNYCLHARFTRCSIARQCFSRPFSGLVLDHRLCQEVLATAVDERASAPWWTEISVGFSSRAASRTLKLLALHDIRESESCPACGAGAF